MPHLPIQPEWTRNTHVEPSGNNLLETLPFEAAAFVGSRMTRVRLRQGTILCRPGERSTVVYFPSSSVISLMACTADTAIEVATVGAEGVVGLPALMGRVAGAMQWMVQVGGMAWRCDAAVFDSEVRGSPAQQGFLRRYEYSVMIQAVQAAACTSAHRLDQRCARWLLATHDRIADDRILMTHDFIARMLGVRRAGVTSALRGFQDRRVIKCRRGAIDIIDRVGLESAACECYGIVRDACDALLGVRAGSTPDSLSA